VSLRLSHCAQARIKDACVLRKSRAARRSAVCLIQMRSQCYEPHRLQVAVQKDGLARNAQASFHRILQFVR
jgi:hypothetical protein